LGGAHPSGPGIISDALIFNIAKSVPPSVETFLLTSHTDAADIINHHQKVHTSTIQIVDTLTKGGYSDIRNAIPFIRLVQVVHVIDESSIEECISIAPQVDAFYWIVVIPNFRSRSWWNRT
jgi:phosphoribosylanthranilate isomerase